MLDVKLGSLLEEGILERVRFPSGECLRVRAPFSIAFSPPVLDWFRIVPPGNEVGGFLGGDVSKTRAGEAMVTITSVVPVGNRAKHPDREYLPDMRSWAPSLRRVLASTPRTLALSFHTHPMEEANLIEAALRHDINLTVSPADMQSSLEIAEGGGMRLQIPQLLMARRPDPLKGVFASIYGSEISSRDLEDHYMRIVSPGRIEHYRALVSLARDAWPSKHRKPGAAALAVGAALGLVLAPELTLAILVGGATSILLTGEKVSFDSIDNKGDADYIGFTSREGPDAVLAFRVPRYSAMDISRVPEVIDRLKAKPRI